MVRRTITASLDHLGNQARGKTATLQERGLPGSLTRIAGWARAETFAPRGSRGFPPVGFVQRPHHGIGQFPVDATLPQLPEYPRRSVSLRETLA